MAKKTRQNLALKDYVSVNFNDLYEHFRKKYNIILELEWFTDKGNDVLVRYHDTLSLSEERYEYKVITEEIRRLYPIAIAERNLLIEVCF